MIPQLVIDTVADHFGLPPSALLRGDWETRDARLVAAWVLRDWYLWPHTRAFESFCVCNHTEWWDGRATPLEAEYNAVAYRVVTARRKWLNEYPLRGEADR